MDAQLRFTITAPQITVLLTCADGRAYERTHDDDGRSATWLLLLVDEVCRAASILPQEITDVHVESVPEREHATITRVARSIAAGLVI